MEWRVWLVERVATRLFESRVTIDARTIENDTKGNILAVNGGLELDP